MSKSPNLTIKKSYKQHKSIKPHPQTKKQNINIIPSNKLRKEQLTSLLKLCKVNKCNNGKLHDTDDILKMPHLVASAAILQSNKIIGYVGILKNPIAQMVKTGKTYNYQLDIVYDNISITKNLQPRLIDFIETNKINKMDVWYRVPEDNINLIVKLLNYGWMFGRKDKDSNIYIFDYRIGKYKILEPSSDIRKYDKTFITSYKKINPELNFEIIEKYLRDAGLKQTRNPKSKPMFLYTIALENDLVSREYYYTECYLMNILSKEAKVITNKHWLYIKIGRAHV